MKAVATILALMLVAHAEAAAPPIPPGLPFVSPVKMSTPSGTAPFVLDSDSAAFTCGGVTNIDDTFFLGFNRTEPPFPVPNAPQQGETFEYGYWANQTGNGQCGYQQETYFNNATGAGTQVTLSGSPSTGTTYSITDTTHSYTSTVTFITNDTTTTMALRLSNQITNDSRFIALGIYSRAYLNVVYLFSRPVVSGLTWTATSSLGGGNATATAFNQISTRPCGITYDSDLGPDGGGKLNVQCSIGRGVSGSYFAVTHSDGDASNPYLLIDPINDHWLLFPIDYNTGCGFDIEDNAGSNAVFRSICQKSQTGSYLQMGPGYAVLGSAGSVILQGAAVFQEQAPASSATISFAATDTILDVITSSTAVATGLHSSPTPGQKATVCDASGTANTHNITIAPAAGNIDGSGTYVINTAWGCWSGHNVSSTLWKTDATH